MKRTYSQLGIHWSIKNNTLYLPRQLERTAVGDVGGTTPKIEDGIWPAFPSDLMSVSIVLRLKQKEPFYFLRKCLKVVCIL